ncbi:unnamed protein product, partial [Brassica napus]
MPLLPLPPRKVRILLNRILNSKFYVYRCCLEEKATRGKIWVVWNPAINLIIHSKSSQMMTCLVQLPNTTDEVAVSFIYGLNFKYGRQHLWEEIKSLARDPIIHGKPWATLDCVEYAGLFDLSIIGNKFTWWSKQLLGTCLKSQETSIIGSAMFSFSQKLKLLKNEILDINREHFSNLEERVKEAHSVLVSFQ